MRHEIYDGVYGRVVFTGYGQECPSMTIAIEVTEGPRTTTLRLLVPKEKFLEVATAYINREKV